MSTKDTSFEQNCIYEYYSIVQTAIGFTEMTKENWLWLAEEIVWGENIMHHRVFIIRSWYQ